MIIFTLIGISMTKEADDLHEKIDFILVFLVNFIMQVQMGSSLLVFVKNIISIIKMRRNRVIPISTNFATYPETANTKT